MNAVNISRAVQSPGCEDKSQNLPKNMLHYIVALKNNNIKVNSNFTRDPRLTPALDSGSRNTRATTKAS